MAANTTPIFVDTVRTEVAQHPAGTTATSVVTGAADGTRVDSVTLNASYAGASTNAVYQILVNDGASDKVIHTGLVVGNTPSATVRPWNDSVTLGIFLQSGHILKVNTATSAGQAIDVSATCGDY